MFLEMPHKNIIVAIFILLSMTLGCRLATDWLKTKTNFFQSGVSQTAAQAVFGENAKITKLHIDEVNRSLGIDVVNSQNPKT